MSREQAQDKPSQLRCWVVSQEHAGQRADNFLLRELKGVPRQLLYRLLRQGKVKLNDKRLRPSYKLVAGDELSVPAIRTAARVAHVPRFARLPQILHEDNDYLVLAKPDGMAVHGGSGQSCGLIELARHVRKQPHLELAHRLDKDTSGVLVLTKSRAGLRWFHEQLRAGLVRKFYRAVVCGQWTGKQRKIDLALQKIPADQGGKRIVVEESGAQSVTKTECLFQGSKGAVLDVELVTGRTHQARAHLSHVGLPILGDARYGDRNCNRMAYSAGHRGLYLHARYLSFKRRNNQGQLDLTCRVPARFATVRQWLAGE